METLHEYGERNGIKYHAAWNRFRGGKIIDIFKTGNGHIFIPAYNGKALGDEQ